MFKKKLLVWRRYDFIVWLEKPIEKLQTNYYYSCSTQMRFDGLYLLIV